MRRDGPLRRLAAGLGILGVLEALAIVAFATIGTERFVFSDELVPYAFLATVTMYSSVGALIAQQRPWSRVPWLMIGVGTGMGFALVTFAYGIIGVGPEFQWQGAIWSLVLSQVLFLPTISLFATWLLLVFPNDRFVGPRWRLVLVPAIAGSVLFIVGSIFKPGILDTDVPPPIANPLGAPFVWTDPLAFAVGLSNAIAVISLALGAASLVTRYRRADPVEAAQIRWIALVGVLAAATLAVGALQAGPISDLCFGLGFVFLALMPVAIGIAITRYRLYEIDRLINRTLVYGSLTAILAGVFTAAVGGAQRLFIAMTGTTSDAAVVATTLVVATLYAPLRKRLESVVDRRFKYEQSTFGSYRDELQRAISLIDPTVAAERLAQEVVRETGALGAAVLGADGEPVGRAGLWPIETATELAVHGGHGTIAKLVVGTRPGGLAVDPRRLAEAQELAALAARAIRPTGDR